MKPPHQKAYEWLSANPKSGSLVAHARKMQAIQADIDRWAAPKRLGLSVCHWAADKLRLSTPHPASVARTRQLLPDLVRFLTSSGWQISAIELRVQVAFSANDSIKSHKSGAVMTESALKAWQALEEGLQDSPLKEAVKRLNAHHKRAQ